MSTILISGDSWGIGVFSGVGEEYGPIGQGIHTILSEAGHSIVNISQGGGSNWLQLDRMEGQWHHTGRSLYGTAIDAPIEFNFKDIDCIVFLQTDVFREKYLYIKEKPTDKYTQWKKLDDMFVAELISQYVTIQDYVDSYFKKMYSKLNQIAQTHNIKVFCVGGWSQLHPSISEYTNLIPTIHSATKLLIPELEEDGYLSDPEWFTQLACNDDFMRKFGLEFKEMTVKNARKLDLIYNTWHEVHPDIEGYRRITEEILAKLDL